MKNIWALALTMVFYLTLLKASYQPSTLIIPLAIYPAVTRYPVIYFTYNLLKQYPSKPLIEIFPSPITNEKLQSETFYLVQGHTAKKFKYRNLIIEGT